MFLFHWSLDSLEEKWSESAWLFLKTEVSRAPAVHMAGSRDVLLPSELLQPQQLSQIAPVPSDRAFPGLKAHQEVSLHVSAPGCVCGGVKDSTHELKIYFLKHLWYLPPSVFQRVLLAPSVPHLLVGENGAGAVGMWGDRGVSSLQCRIGLRGWAEAGQGCAGAACSSEKVPVGTNAAELDRCEEMEFVWSQM